MIKNELNKALLRLYKQIAKITKDILTIFDTLCNINTITTLACVIAIEFALARTLYYLLIIKISFYKR